MYGDRIEGLRQSGARFIEILQKERASNLSKSLLSEEDDQVWVSVLPYTARVNLSRYPAFFDSPPPDETAACPDPRYGDPGQDDSPLSLGLLPNVGSAGSRGSQTERLCPAAFAIGPTRSLEPVQRELRNLPLNPGCTRFDLGTIWGWRAVSPQWWSAWQGADDSLPLPPETSKKIVVILTDGYNTPSCAHDPGTRGDADALFLAACEAMKDQGIRPYTIYFGEPLADLQDLLARCSEGTGQTYHAADNPALMSVFEGIARDVAELPLAAEGNVQEGQLRP